MERPNRRGYAIAWRLKSRISKNQGMKVDNRKHQVLYRIYRGLLAALLVCIVFTAEAQKEDQVAAFSKTPGGMPLVEKGKAVEILTDTADYPVVGIAANDLTRDIFRVTGARPLLSHQAVTGNQIVIGTLGRSRLVDQLVDVYHLEVSKLKGQWEKFLIQVIDLPGGSGKKILAIIGSDRRATAYGAYELSRQIGVSPWYFWADVPVKQHNVLYAQRGQFLFGPPSIRYRGIFINDEGIGLGRWARTVFDPGSKVMGPAFYAKVYELMLRLKANFMWPAMKGPESFYSVPGNKEMADRYGIIVGTSHHEPLMVASSLEWKDKRDGPWQYDINGAKMRAVMDQRVKEVAPYENIYSIGLRDNADKGMKAEGGMDYQIALMERIFADQRAILEKDIHKPADSIPQAFTAYKEVLDLVNNGLKVPDDAILVWPDDNYGYISQLNSDIQKRRSGGSGLYYHLNYVGRPYSSGWLGAPSPELIREELNKAYGNGVNKLWLFNVGDIKPYAFLTSYCLDLAWKFPYDNVTKTRSFMLAWLGEVFGKNLSDKIAPVLRGYYQASFERKTEFMGWNRSEPNTPTVNTEYSLSNYNDLNNRLNELDGLSRQVKALYKEVPEALKATFFEWVYYPVVAADLVNKKMLYGQINRLYGTEQRMVANDYAVFSQNMQDSLEVLTKAYDMLSGGKWKGIMPLQSTGKIKTPLMKVTPAAAAEMDIDYSGRERIAGAKDDGGLPYFSKFYHETYTVFVYNKGMRPFKWGAIVSDPWIKLSKYTGNCSKEDSISVSIDYSRLPKGSLPAGSITLTGANSVVRIAVRVFNPVLSPESLKGLFVEQKGVISLKAADYQRKIDRGPYKWVILNDVGLSGRAVAVQPDSLPQVAYDWNLTEHAPSLEYDFYTFNQGWMDIHSFTLPTHPISLQRGCLYGISVDNQPPKIIDFSTRGRTEDWMVGVMHNTSEQVSRHFIASPGRHTLKVWLIDTGVCFDKFIIDAGGLKPSYSGPPESKF